MRTNQYLNFKSNHHVSLKLAVPKTLLNRVDTVITDEMDMPNEEALFKKALEKCGYPEWTVKRRKNCQNKNLMGNGKTRKIKNQNQLDAYSPHT